MGVEHAVRLAQGFAASGFSSVIEGLDAVCHPGPGWSEQAFGRQRVVPVALLCEEAVVVHRWQARGGGDQRPQSVLADLRWYQRHHARVDWVVETARPSPEHSAALIAHRCVVPGDRGGREASTRTPNHALQATGTALGVQLLGVCLHRFAS